jgi:quercetin dioxygenase-like cupin family protein
MLPDVPGPQSKSTMNVLQEVPSALIPGDADVVTVLINHPPGAPGYPPHRLPGGPGFGYMISGELLFELEGAAPQVLRAGDAFWGPGGDVIHYQDANYRADIACSFVLTILRKPGQPLLERVSEEELEDRKHLRVRRTHAGAAATGCDPEGARADQWRQATRGLVLMGATATAAAHPAHSRGSVSITLTGSALSNDLLLADSGNIALTSLGDHPTARSHPMTVIPMRLDMLSELPVIRVSARGVTEPTQLQLVVELTARNPHTDAMAVMACEFDSVLLDAQTPRAVMDFVPPQRKPSR